MAARMTRQEFVRRQSDLQRRIARQRPRSRMAQRLTQELQQLVLGDLRRAPIAPAAPTSRPDLCPVPEYPEEEGHELAWWQK